MPRTWAPGSATADAPVDEPAPDDRYFSGAYVGVLLLTAVVVGIWTGWAAEKDLVLSTLRGLPFTDTIAKRSQKRPLVFVLKQNHEHRLDGGLLDQRPRSMRVKEAWARVQMKQGAYEGNPQYYASGDTAFELYLTPACRIVVRGGTEQAVPVAGPGVLIFEPEIRSIELLDQAESGCGKVWAAQPVAPAPGGTTTPPAASNAPNAGGAAGQP